MTAIGYTTGDPTKVNKTGDTMTGDLNLSGATTDLNVDGVITDGYAGVTGDVMRFITTSLSTAITSGGVVTINGGDATKFDVTATAGWVVDYNPIGAISATNPKLTMVNYAGGTGLTITLPPAVQVVFLLIDSAGTLIQQATAPTRTQFRTHMVLAAVARPGGTILEINSLLMVAGQPEAQLYDLGRSLGGFSLTGLDNYITPNGANLQINTTGGNIYFPGLNTYTNYQDPSVAVLAAQTPASFNRLTAVANVGGTFNTIDVANFDLNGTGVITPVGGGTNTSTIFRVFAIRGAAPGNQLFVQYGQHTYASLAAARDGIGSIAYITNPVFIRQALVGWICVTRSATDLSDPTQAIFVRASKFAIP